MQNGNNKKRKKQVIHQTNGWDVLKAIVDGVFNFLSLGNVAAFAICWFIIRDIIFVINLPKDYDYGAHLLNSDFLEYIANNDNIMIIVLIGIGLFLLISCIALIMYILFLKREIKRVAAARSEAMHGKEKINHHSSSEF